MSEWALKRFWKEVAIDEGEKGYSIRLDARPVHTPAKRGLTVPTRAIAERIAAEWDAQEEAVDPGSMPWTRSANAAIDKVAFQRDEVETHLIGYAGSDLLSYRAESPDALIARQVEQWDPVLAWIVEAYGARMVTTQGVMPVAQSPESLAKLKTDMTKMSDFQLTGFHDLVTLTGSYVLALGAVHRYAPPEVIWQLSRLDEDWQIEQWGEDEEAAEHTEIKRLAFLHAEQFFHAA